MAAEESHLLRSIKSLEIAHLCNSVAVYWTVFIVLESIVNMIFLPLSLVAPLNLLIVPYIVARIVIVALARIGIDRKVGLSGMLYLGAVSAKILECAPQKRDLLVFLMAALATVLLYAAYLSPSDLALYFGLASLLVVNAGVYAWFVEPYCFARGVVYTTLIAIPYVVLELYLTKPSPIHVFATMSTADVLAILGIVLVGVKGCLTARR